MNSLLAFAALAAGFQGGNINDYVSSKFQDATFTAHVQVGSQIELRKINKDFGESYRFEYTQFKLKEPFKVRGETKVDDTQILFLLNGPTRVFRAPKQRINIKQNLASKPGQRQTAMDFGFLLPSMFDGNFMNAKFVRLDRASGDAVFDLTYESKFKDTSRHRVWIDPSKKYTTKREWYGQDGNLKATFIYTGPQGSGGVYLPTKMTVKNAEGKIAGETYYTGLKVNTGLDDSLFTP